MHETCHYLLEAVLPLLQVKLLPQAPAITDQISLVPLQIFFRSYYDQDYEEHPQELKLLDRLAQELLVSSVLDPFDNPGSRGRVFDQTLESNGERNAVSNHLNRNA